MRVVIITGVSRGLGKEILELFLTTSNQIVCIGRVFPKIEIHFMKTITFIKQDMSDDFSSITSSDLGINKSTQEVVFINNAGTIEPISRVGQFTHSNIKTAISVNFIYPVYITNNLISICRENNITLRILNITTGAAKSPFAGWSLYCATKAATRMFFDCLVLENERFSVKHIDPGVMDTGMQETIRNAQKEHFPEKDKFIKFKCNNELKSPRQVARKILAGEGYL